MIDHLNRVNNRPVYSVRDEKFKTYGRIIENHDFSELIKFMEDFTEIPESGNVYFPSIKEMENFEEAETLKKTIYGDMPIQIGYCNGKNSTINGFEFHKGSEINVAVTNQALFLGHVWDLKNNYYHESQAELFYLERGEAILLFETTLHLSPCKVQDSGFKTIVVLPEGTNTEIDETYKINELTDELLLMKNKWVIAHPDRKPLIDRGAYPGLQGDNITLHYE